MYIHLHVYIYVYTYVDETLLSLDQQPGETKKKLWPRGPMRAQPMRARPMRARPMRAQPMRAQPAHSIPGVQFCASENIIRFGSKTHGLETG